MAAAAGNCRSDMSRKHLWCTRMIIAAAAVAFAALRANALPDDDSARLTLQPVEAHGIPTVRATLTHFPADPVVSVRVERPDGKSEDAVVEQQGGAFVASYPRADVPGEYTFVVCAAADETIRIARKSVTVGPNRGSAGTGENGNAAPSRTAASTTATTSSSPRAENNNRSSGSTPSSGSATAKKRTAASGSATVADVGTVQSIDGQYVRWNRGTVHGIRQGRQVRLLRHGIEIGRGRVIDVRETDSDVEIDSVSGVAEVAVGDAVDVEARTVNAGPP